MRGLLVPYVVAAWVLGFVFGVLVLRLGWVAWFARRYSALQKIGDDRLTSVALRPGVAQVRHMLFLLEADVSSWSAVESEQGGS